MRALVLDGSAVRFDPNYPEPQPCKDDCSIVDVSLAGVCETDLQLMQGYMGFQGVLGHEFVGIAQNGPLAGQRVVGEINCNCRSCDDCQNDLGNHCSKRSVIGILNHDGAFADRLIVPNHNLLAVPDNISNEEAVFTEPLAAAFQIPDQVKFNSGDVVVVLGDGRLGNLCAQVIHQIGCELTVVGKHEAKLDRLRKLGIKCKTVSEFETSGTRANVVVDCTGSPTGLQAALQSVKPRGTVVLKTTVAATPDYSLAQIVIDEINVVGSRCGPFDKALAALAAKQIEVTSLIDDRFSIADGVNALKKASEPGVMKVLIEL